MTGTTSPSSFNIYVIKRFVQTESINMPTPLSLGFEAKYSKADPSNNKHPKHRHVAIVTGWLGAKERQLKPYLQFYHEKGIDTISFAVGPKQVLFPKYATDQVKNVLSEVMKLQNEVEEKHLHLIFHNFSVGGFLYGQMLRLLATNDNKFSNIPSIVKAQIFDSPPDFNGIATGVSKSMGIGGFGEKLIEYSLKGFLKVTENSSGVEHRASSQAFHNNFIKAPSLWYYSHADPVAKFEDCEMVVNKWKQNGIDVLTCTWKDTPHIQHARFDPNRYFEVLDSFLVSNDIIVKK